MAKDLKEKINEILDQGYVMSVAFVDSDDRPYPVWVHYAHEGGADRLHFKAQRKPLTDDSDK